MTGKLADFTRKILLSIYVIVSLPSRLLRSGNVWCSFVLGARANRSCLRMEIKVIIFITMLCPNFNILLIMVNTGSTITTPDNLGIKEISKRMFIFFLYNNYYLSSKLSARNYVCTGHAHVDFAECN